MGEVFGRWLDVVVGVGRISLVMRMLFFMLDWVQFLFLCLCWVRLSAGVRRAMRRTLFVQFSPEILCCSCCSCCCRLCFCWFVFARLLACSPACLLVCVLARVEMKPKPNRYKPNPMKVADVLDGRDPSGRRSGVGSAGVSSRAPRDRRPTPPRLSGAGQGE